MKKAQSSHCEGLTLALTVIAEAAGWLVGPDAQAGANDAGGAIGRVAGLTAVHQQGAWRKGSPVGLCSVQQISVLHGRRLRATWRQDAKEEEKKKKKKNRVKTLLLLLPDNIQF